VFGERARIAQRALAVGADKFVTAPAPQFVLGQLRVALEVAGFAFGADHFGEQVLARRPVRLFAVGTLRILAWRNGARRRMQFHRLPAASKAAPLALSWLLVPVQVVVVGECAFAVLALEDLGGSGMVLGNMQTEADIGFASF
jgi:hypothetical protein